MAKGKKEAPPAEERETDAPAAEEAPKKKGGGKLKLIIAAVLGLVVIGGGGAFVGMKFLAPAPEAAPVPAPAAPEGGAELPPPPPAEEAAPPISDPADGGEAAAEGGHGGGGGEGGGAEGEVPPEPVGPQNIEFKPFIVNLNDGAGKRFLKLTMSVEAETPELADEINLKTPQFRDTILLLLSSLSFDDIATLDGKMRLRNQMLNRVNTQLTSGKIKNIYFSEFVVQ